MFGWRLVRKGERGAELVAYEQQVRELTTDRDEWRGMAKDLFTQLRTQGLAMIDAQDAEVPAKASTDTADRAAARAMREKSDELRRSGAT